MKKTLLLLLFIPAFIFSCKDDSTSADDGLEGLIWSDEFDGNDWSRDNWEPQLGASGWGNNELQNYTASDDNIQVSDGTLKIIARKVGEDGEQGVGDYTSARMNSIQTFGPGTRIEVRAKIPDLKGNGLWPAIWMLGESIRSGGVGWPDCGEIDIMEYVSYNPNTFYTTIHSAANNHVDGTALGSGDITLNNIEEEFNIFGFEWHEEYIRFFVNDVNNAVYRVNRPAEYDLQNWPFSEPHYFLLNLAVGGDWGGALGVNDDNFPATFEIDYVRVFEL